MKRVVLKFGGTSVADAESRQAVAAIIRDTKEICGELIVVVSAMGRKGAPYATDTLLQVYGDGQDLPKNREQDMIYACGEIISGSVLAQELNTQGLRSVFLTGGQAGIETDDHYSEANILTVHTDRLKKWLAQDYIIIVAGGQGMTASGDITATGRGGSDTTACAIGYYTGADEVRIYTDVDGIYTGDPRVIQNARKIPCLSYSQCHRLAAYGAKVIHPRAVAYAELGQKNVLSVRSTFLRGSGTKIGDYESSWNGITASRNLLTLTTTAEESVGLVQTLKQYGAEPCYTLSDELGFHCGIDGRLMGREDIPQGQLRDVIFAVGPAATPENVSKTLCKDWEGEILRLSEDSVAVTVAPELYERQINLLHDGICLV